MRLSSSSPARTTAQERLLDAASEFAGRDGYAQLTVERALTSNVAQSKKFSLCGANLVMPTTITGQNGAVIQRKREIAVTGCARAKSLTRKQKSPRRWRRAIGRRTSISRRRATSGRGRSTELRSRRRRGRAARRKTEQYQSSTATEHECRISTNSMER